MCLFFLTNFKAWKPINHFVFGMSIKIWILLFLLFVHFLWLVWVCVWMWCVSAYFCMCVGVHMCSGVCAWTYLHMFAHELSGQRSVSDDILQPLPTLLIETESLRCLRHTDKAGGQLANSEDPIVSAFPTLRMWAHSLTSTTYFPWVIGNQFSNHASMAKPLRPLAVSPVLKTKCFALFPFPFFSFLFTVNFCVLVMLIRANVHLCMVDKTSNFSEMYFLKHLTF